MKSIFRFLIGALMALPMLYALPTSAEQSGAASKTGPIKLAQRALTPEEKAKRRAARKAKRQQERKAKRRANQNKPAARKKALTPKQRANQQKRNANQRQRNENQRKRNANQRKRNATEQQQLNAKKRRVQKQRQDAIKRQNRVKNQQRKLNQRDKALDARAKRLRRRDQNLDNRRRSINKQAVKRRRNVTKQAIKRRKVQTRKLKRNTRTFNRLQKRRRALSSKINTKRNRTVRLQRRNNRLARQRDWLLNQRRNARRTYRRNFAWRERARVVNRRRGRTIFTALAGAAVGAAIVSSYYVYHNDSTRLHAWNARDVYVDDVGNGWTRNVVLRPNGVRVVTIRDVDGFIVRRYRVYPGNRITMLYDNRPAWWDEGDLAVEVRPVRYSGPRSSYIVEPTRASIDDVYDAVVADPVDEIDRTYTLNQILVNRNLRDYMPRIDMDSIRFASGSSEIPDEELDRLDAVGAAMEAAIKENPDEVYLIEGHTDATGDREDNLILSDERAAAIANALTEYYDIPPENLVTQGYGEEFLKVDTGGPEQRNRRVAIRRITPLLSKESDDIALDDDGNEIFESL